MRRIANTIFAISFCSLAVACSTVRLPNQGNVKVPIEMNTYKIILSDERSWKDWEASTKTENDALMLRKLKIWPLNGEVQGLTTMIVIKDTFAPQASALSETEHADTVRAMEEKIMNEEGVNKGRYEIQELTKGDLTRHGKKLYFMTWTTSGSLAIPTLNRRTAYTKGAMYLYFPEGYKDTHTFYRFLITDTLYPPTFFKADIEHIHPLIDGFAVK
jgi:hypothetical protein